MVSLCWKRCELGQFKVPSGKILWEDLLMVSAQEKHDPLISKEITISNAFMAHYKDCGVHLFFVLDCKHAKPRRRLHWKLTTCVWSSEQGLIDIYDNRGSKLRNQDRICLFVIHACKTLHELLRSNRLNFND